MLPFKDEENEREAVLRFINVVSLLIALGAGLAALLLDNLVNVVSR